MNFLQLAKQRYSCRSYKNIPVEDEKLQQILEAGRIAPSAVNFQPWIFIIIKDSENKKQLYSTYNRDWIRTAPVLIVVCGDHSKSWKRGDGKDYCDVDIAIAVDHITLQAAQLGLGTCWVCNFDRAKLSDVLNLPTHIEPIVILPLGYPSDFGNPERHSSARKEVNAIVRFEKYEFK